MICNGNIHCQEEGIVESYSPDITTPERFRRNLETGVQFKGSPQKTGLFGTIVPNL